MKTAFQHADYVCKRLQLEGLLNYATESEFNTIRYRITEAITDALIEQVEYARSQAPVVHVHTGGQDDR